MVVQASNVEEVLTSRARGLLIVAGIVVLGAMVLLFHYAAENYVLSQAELRIRDVMLESRALHWYVQRNMHPALYKAKEDGRIPSGFYAPEMLSSTCIARNLYEHYNEERGRAGLPEVRYRLAAIDPRNPVNRADGFERALIEEFNADRGKKEHREVIDVDGRAYLYYAIPFLVTEQRCLSCHGAPEDAPQELREYYDWSGGWHRRVGDIVALESVSTPLEAEFHAAHIMLAASVGVAGLLLSMFLINTRLRGLVRRHTQALQESEERFSAFMEYSPCVAFIKDEQGRFLYANRYLADLFGVDRDLTGQTTSHLVPNSMGQAMEEEDQRALAGGHVEVEQVVRDRAGAERVFQTHKFAIQRPGRPSLLGGFALDITARVRAEAQQQSLEAQLRQAQKMEAVGQLAGGVAHDFNNILTAILGNVELSMAQLQSQTPSASKALQGLSQIEKSAERATSLTRQLLAFSRRQVTQPEILDLNQTLNDMADMLRRLITENIDLELSPAANLHLVRADAAQIEQVIMNLVVNASDAMPTGGKLRIATANVALDDEYLATHADARPGEHAVLAVSDTGVGMDQETIEHIFEPFFTTKDVGHGTGLGLATVYGIIRQADGHIRVYSEPEKGSTFRVYLPAIENAVAPDRAARLTGETPGGDETVMLCEDDEKVRKLAEQFLSGAGYTVITARDGESALETAAVYEGDIDLLVTDVIMPNMNGQQLAHAVVDKRPDLKILFMSGYAANVVAHHGVLDPDVEYLEKPFTRRRFLQRVRAMLDS